MPFFSEKLIEELWNMASIVPGYDPMMWRQDFAGAWICRTHFGIRTEYGWTIDHLKPISKGGSDEVDNLISLHWKNSQCKKDDYPVFGTCVSSKDNTNVDKIQRWKL